MVGALSPLCGNMQEQAMGNRAVITTRKRNIGVYIHWHGGRDSVAPFLKYCELRGFIPPEEDGYGWARFCQVVGNYFGGDISLGIDTLDELDCDNRNNGVYCIENWKIVGREFFKGPEQNEHGFLSMLCEINDKQPKDDQLAYEDMVAGVAPEDIPGIEIRPCAGDDHGNVVSVGVSDAEAEFFGVYRQDEDGQWEHLEDFSSRNRAATFVLALHEE
jgi:hypothetical protein